MHKKRQTVLFRAVDASPSACKYFTFHTSNDLQKRMSPYTRAGIHFQTRSGASFLDGSPPARG